MKLIKNYKHNQYCKSDNRNIVNAIYVNQGNKSYIGNKLIEALPISRSPLSICEDFTSKIEYSEYERELPAELILHEINKVFRFMNPLQRNIDIHLNLDMIIKMGYIEKELHSRKRTESLKCTSSDLRNSLHNEDYNYEKSFLSAPLQGFMIYGLAGQGKSTSVDIALNSIPQVIIHENDDGRQTQISWIKFDCSYNGNVSGICDQFFKSIDCLLGTNYANKYERHKINAKINAIKHLANLYNLGVIVMDEMQNLRGLKNGNNNGESAMNFFATLMNGSLPIVFIGTYKALESNIGKDFSRARRTNGISSVECGMISKIEYNRFITELWKFQWTKGITALTEDIITIMYKLSAGSSAETIKLYAAVQRFMVIRDIAKITVKIIEHVAKTEFKLTYEMIDSVSNKKIKKMQLYDDLYPKSILEAAKDEVVPQEKTNAIYVNLINEVKHEDSESLQAQMDNKTKKSGKKKASKEIDIEKFIQENTKTFNDGLTTAEEHV